MKMISQAMDEPGEGEFVLVRWLKADGEIVRVGEPIAEIETEKASVAIDTWATGVLYHIAKAGDRLTLDTLEDGFAQIEPISE